MQDIDEVETRKTLCNLKKICKWISFILSFLLILLCVYWLFALGTMLWSHFSSEYINIRNDLNLINIFLYFLHGLVVASLLIVFIRIFSSAAKGESPFVMGQIRRLRIVAALLLAYAIVDSAVSFNNTLIQFDAMNYGYISTGDSAIVAINFTPFAAAAIVFAFSFVFKYGVLLQEFSDETL
ncbi:hypothetical protein [Gordonibacter sp. 28C]|uniref:hypothetical protein n=1 Tax=Gordonibacter sp. 28C TaxID=2078569 RepID=UPI000DF820E3|nr:hypothetical protein [Gordonibacter sp. 28C]